MDSEAKQTRARDTVHFPKEVLSPFLQGRKITQKPVRIELGIGEQTARKIDNNKKIDRRIAQQIADIVGISLPSALEGQLVFALHEDVVWAGFHEVSVAIAKGDLRAVNESFNAISFFNTWNNEQFQLLNLDEQQLGKLVSLLKQNSLITEEALGTFSFVHVTWPEPLLAGHTLREASLIALKAAVVKESYLTIKEQIVHCLNFAIRSGSEAEFINRQENVVSSFMQCVPLIRVWQIQGWKIAQTRLLANGDDAKKSSKRTEITHVIEKLRTCFSSSSELLNDTFEHFAEAYFTALGFPTKHQIDRQISS